MKSSLKQQSCGRGRQCGARARGTFSVFPFVLVLAGWFPAAAAAQESSARLAVEVRSTAAEPIEGADVRVGSRSGVTNAIGAVLLEVPGGAHEVQVRRLGYEAAALQVVVHAGRDTTITVVLEEAAIETEAIIVSSTRSERRIEDEPVRVEVIGREEIEEKLMMTPGDIAMLLNETAGLRVQPAAASTGGAGVRIQGLRGRYTQILSDGLPLYGGQTGGLGPLQIPPMDLGQVEVIKGAASAMYGASAVGGVVSLVSRRPAEEAEREVLVNQSTLGGTDVIGWASQALGERWGYTVLAGLHRQTHADVDDDGWADLASYRRIVARPRVFWNNGSGSSVLFTAGGMVEDREGGTVSGGLTPDGGTYEERIDTRRIDGGAIGRFLLRNDRLLTVRGSAALQSHEHRFGPAHEPDTHATSFLESALTGTSGAHTWVIGAAVQHERYAADAVPVFDYTHTVAGLFAQDEFDATPWLTLALSARLDHHNEYGGFLNPRLSALLRPAQDWTARASVGTGYFAPTPWTEETEAIGLLRLVPSSLDAERATSASLDIARAIGPLEFNATVFGSRIDEPLQARTATTDSTRIELFNAESSVRTAGLELLARYHAEGVHITATYVRMRSTEPEPSGRGRRPVPLTPKQTAGLVAALEQEDRGRFGIEVYYTGEQPLDDNPYRSDSRPYVVVGALVERRFGPARVFVNAENIFDTRQTRYDPLVLPARSRDGRWLTDLWAPVEGRAINAGVRLSL